MLRWKGIGCPDDFLSPYAHPHRAAHSRLLDEMLCCGLGDAEAWAVIVGDEATREVVDSKGRTRIVLAGPLDTFRVIYGNRPKRRTRTGQQPRRASHRAADVPIRPRAGRSPEIAEQGRLL